MIRFAAGASSLIRMYELFDGEVMWGAWLPGYRICSLAEALELMEATEASWEWLEEEWGKHHPMRLFVPIIQTFRKTSIGPLLDDQSELFGHVVEYDYEYGNIRIWSKSIDQFLDAFFEFALAHIDAPQSAEAGVEATPYEFSESDTQFLSGWPDVAFPVTSEPFRDVGEL